MNRKSLQQYAYDILCNVYPRKMSAKEIAELICQISGIQPSPRQVRENLKDLATRNLHFAKYYPSPHRIKFSVYILTPPFSTL